MSVQRIFTASLVGIDAALVEVEADVSNGLPITIIVGLPDAAVQESRERIRSAIKHSSFIYPQTRVSLNLAPANIPKIGTHLDLPLAIAILLAAGLVKIPKHSSLNLGKSLFAGELSLDGTIRGCSGVLAMVQAARDADFTSCFVPADIAQMASLVKGIMVYPLISLRQLTDYLSGLTELHPLSPRQVKTVSSDHSIIQIDFEDIAEQHHAKRALEIVAAGGHNLLMTGPPGSGKTMLAKALPSILPPLALEEILELTKIYNSSGKLQSGIITQRPMRSPHHSASSVSLIGGGGVPRPGEVTLAHNGVLFLDEFPEFSRTVLEVLRQPLEENQITITRSKLAYTFPASFILIAAQNPCPCGNFGQIDLDCTCSVLAVQNYQKKISGPLLDRIDLHINVPRLKYKEIMRNHDKDTKSLQECSAQVRTRVAKARAVQTSRYHKPQTNSEMTTKHIEQYCALDQYSSNLLEQAADQYKLSGRSIHRVLKVARTIADLEQSEIILQTHLAESLQYRLI